MLKLENLENLCQSLYHQVIDVKGRDLMIDPPFNATDERYSKLQTVLADNAFLAKIWFDNIISYDCIMRGIFDTPIYSKTKKHPHVLYIPVGS